AGEGWGSGGAGGVGGGEGGGGGGGGTGRGGYRGPMEFPAQAIYIHCAADTTSRDRQIAALREGFESDLAELDDQSRQQLHTLRERLLLINLITFAAVAGGAWLLTRAGLLPLRRLSEAVSKVSERDFRLP